MNLCETHLLALDRLRAGSASGAYNLGNGSGFSVEELIDCAQRVAGISIAQVNAPRCAGDPAKLVADSRLARAELGWTPRYGDLETIVAHAWGCEQRVCGRR